MFLLNGEPLAPDQAFVHEGIKYPSNWLRLSTEDERLAIGISEVPDPPIYDQQFYYGYTASGTLIPQEHEPLVALWSKNTRHKANTIMQPSDWYIIRESDSGSLPPSGLKEWRQLVREACEAKVFTIESTTSTEQLAEYITYITPSGGAPSDYNYWPPAPSGI